MDALPPFRGIMAGRQPLIFLIHETPNLTPTTATVIATTAGTTVPRTDIIWLWAVLTALLINADTSNAGVSALASAAGSDHKTLVIPSM